jgi:hypothetical protein
VVALDGVRALSQMPQEAVILQVAPQARDAHTGGATIVTSAEIEREEGRKGGG